MYTHKLTAGHFTFCLFLLLHPFYLLPFYKPFPQQVSEFSTDLLQNAITPCSCFFSISYWGWSRQRVCRIVYLNIFSKLKRFFLWLIHRLSISSQCQTTLLGVAGSSDASCLNIAGLTPLLVASQNESLIEPVNNWLAGACAEDACTDSQISNIVSNITSGCSSDLDSANIDSSDLTSIIQQAYPTVRSAACLKDTTNNTLCLTSLLTDIQNEKGTLSISNIVNWVSLVFNGEATDLPSYITCSDCVKQAYNVVNSQQQAVATSTDVASAFQSQCGADFTGMSFVPSIFNFYCSWEHNNLTVTMYI